MRLTTNPVGYRVDVLETTGLAQDPAGWFERQPNTGEGGWFLAHADDGIIWGQNRDGHLLLSGTVFPAVSPPLRTITLQQARLFGEQAEVRLWRNGNDFAACRVEDFSGSDSEALDEEYLLWGDQVKDQKNGFSLMADGVQGLLHAVPLDVVRSSSSLNSRGRLLRLKLRHYLSCDQDGRAHIRLSRLVNLGQI